MQGGFALAEGLLGSLRPFGPFWLLWLSFCFLLGLCHLCSILNRRNYWFLFYLRRHSLFLDLFLGCRLLYDNLLWDGLRHLNLDILLLLGRFFFLLL